MFNHAGPPQIWGFPGIGPSNDRGDAKACNHVGTAMVANHLESIREKIEGGRRIRSRSHRGSFYRAEIAPVRESSDDFHSSLRVVSHFIAGIRMCTSKSCEKHIRRNEYAAPIET